MRSIFLGMVALLGLAGCEPAKPVEAMGYAERRQLAEQVVERCAALGLELDTPKMDQCVTAEAQKEIFTRRMNAPQHGGTMLIIKAGGSTGPDKIAATADRAAGI